MRASVRDVPAGTEKIGDARWCRSAVQIVINDPTLDTAGVRTAAEIGRSCRNRPRHPGRGPRWFSPASSTHRPLRHFGVVEHEFVIYPREGHSIRERHHQLDLPRRTRAWFDRWLQP
jgi:hypothetical protein